MKKIIILLFLFTAGIVFSQTEPLQAENELQELLTIENEDETDLLSDSGEENTDELTQTEEEPEESPENALSSEDTAPSSKIVKRAPFWITEQDKTITHESPQWAKDLGRGEIIAFGAFPIMVFFSRIFIDLYRTAIHNWDNSYAPWPFTGPNSVGLTTDEVKLMFGVAAITSVMISVSDHFIIRHKRKKAALKAAPRSTLKAKPESPANIENHENINDQNNDEADETIQDNDAIDDGA